MIPEARDVWLRINEESFGNPSSQHRIGFRADRLLEEARHDLALMLHGEDHSIVWTSGATESNNLSLFQARQAAPEDAVVWISSIEHPCLRAAALRYFGESGVEWIPVDRSGRVELDWIISRLKTGDRPFLIAVMAANNETGAIQPWQELQRISQEHEIFFLCDAAQWLGKEPAAGLGACDWVTGSSHKFGGPKGCGFLKIPTSAGWHSEIRKTIRRSALLVGGPQEMGRRAGTENPAAVCSMVAALKQREDLIRKPGFRKSMEQWRDSFEAELMEFCPDIQVLSHPGPRLWNTSELLMPEPDNCRARWVVKLDRLGMAVSTGSACSSGKEVISPVLQAMQIPDSRATQSVRISSGWETVEEDWRLLGARMRELVVELTASHGG